MLQGSMKKYEEKTSYQSTHRILPYEDQKKLADAAIAICESFGYVPGVMVKLKFGNRVGVIKELVDNPMVTLGQHNDQPRVLRIEYTDSKCCSYFSLDEIEELT